MLRLWLASWSWILRDQTWQLHFLWISHYPQNPWSLSVFTWSLTSLSIFDLFSNSCIEVLTMPTLHGLVHHSSSQHWRASTCFNGRQRWANLYRNFPYWDKLILKCKDRQWQYKSNLGTEVWIELDTLRHNRRVRVSLYPRRASALVGMRWSWDRQVQLV